MFSSSFAPGRLGEDTISYYETQNSGKPISSQCDYQLKLRENHLKKLFDMVLTFLSIAVSFIVNRTSINSAHFQFDCILQ